MSSSGNTGLMSQATITALNNGARKEQFAPWGGSPVRIKEGGGQKGKTTTKKQKKS